MFKKLIEKILALFGRKPEEKTAAPKETLPRRPGGRASVEATRRTTAQK